MEVDHVRNLLILETSDLQKRKKEMKEMSNSRNANRTSVYDMKMSTMLQLENAAKMHTLGPTTNLARNTE